MMKHAPVVALALASILVAGCGGGSSITKAEADRLQEERDAALEAEAEAKRKQAQAEQDAADEKRRADAAEQQRDAAQGEVTDAEEEARQAEKDRDEAQQTLNRFVALEIVNATPTAITTEDRNLITVPALSYQKPALVTVTGAQFTSTSTGSSSGWFKTTRSGSSEQRKDSAEIFSNVEVSTKEDFRDHSLGSGLTYDSNGKVLGANNHINITTNAHGNIAASSRFPSPSTQRQGEKETFTVTDRGPTQEQKTAAIAEKKRIDDLNKNNDPDDDEVFDETNDHYDNYRLLVRNMDRYPERYSIDISGTLQGASGKFRCAGSSATGTCSVDISGPNDYIFAAATDTEWQFIPTSATSKVIIPDAEYMWFGWWMRAPFETTPNAVNAVYDFAADYARLLHKSRDVVVTQALAFRVARA